MKVKIIHRTVLIALLSMYCLCLYAVKATPKIIKFIQPDGTAILLKVSGDEFFGFKRTLSGDLVEVGGDGFLHNVTFTSVGRLICSEKYKIGASNNVSLNRLEQIRLSNIAQRMNENADCKPFKVPEIVKNHALTKSGGSTRIPSLVLLVEFSDVKFTVDNPRNTFNNMLNQQGYSLNGATGCACDYLRDNFNNGISFIFDVSNVISLSAPISKYGAPSGTLNDVDARQLAVDACAAAYSAGIDFSKYDYDNDGFVDNVSIIFAGHNEAEGGDANSIWPHQWDISGKNILYNGVKLGSYSCSSELAGAQDNVVSPIGNFCHEFLHSLGLPDMYDTNAGEEGLSNALYNNLSIMDAGNYLNNGNTPPYLNAIERQILNLAEMEDLLPDNSYNVLPINKTHKIYRIPTLNEGEYFLLECRAMNGWDEYLKGEGLMVYHVDKSEAIYGGIASSKRWTYNNVNCLANHECAKVICAAPIAQENVTAPLFFPGSNFVTNLLSVNCYMNLRDWADRPVGIEIKNIEFKNNEVNFTTALGYSFSQSFPKAEDIVCVPYQVDARLVWNKSQQEISDEKWAIRWKESQSNEFKSKVIDCTNVVIDNLKPGTEYNVEIFCVKDMVYGQKSVFNFSTVPVSSVYPYLFVNKEYLVGSEADLRVFNISEPYSLIRWYIDDTPITGSSFVVNKAGLHSIKAVINYKDGSKEKLYKKILAK